MLLAVFWFWGRSRTVCISNAGRLGTQATERVPLMLFPTYSRICPFGLSSLRSEDGDGGGQERRECEQALCLWKADWIRGEM